MTTEGTPDWGVATVVATLDAATDIRLISLQRRPLTPAQPGCHVDVRVPVGTTTLTRSYSVVESDTSRSTLSISVLRTPDSRGGSAAMHALRPGDMVEMTQPLQNFPLRPRAASYVLVAGGIGITAIMPMATTLRRAGADYTLFYAGRSRQRMAFVERLETEHGDRLRLRVSGEGTRADPSEVVRQVTDGTQPGLTEAYMCGPIRLMDALHSAWASAGLPASNLRFETFGGGGSNQSAAAFRLTIPQTAVDTHVAPDESLLQALLRVGVPTMYDCLKGECGLCVLDVTRVDGTIDHRDVFLSRQQKVHGSTIVTCVSRVTGAEGRTAAIELALP